MHTWLRRILLGSVLLGGLALAVGGAVYVTHWELLRGAAMVDAPEEASLSAAFPWIDSLDYGKREEALAFASGLNTTAVIAIYDGRLVAEWGRTDLRIDCHSVRKSIVSALYGIAVERELIDIDKTLKELDIDEINPPLTTAEKKARLADLLTSRSGIYHDSVKMDTESGRPERGSHAPGTAFFYNNWGFNALGGIFEQLAGLSLGEAFKQWIADPTGMQDFRVEDMRYFESEVSVFPAYRFRMSARDLARFGVLYLQEGEWEGARIIDADWIRASVTPYSEVRSYGYGYLWWTREDGSYFATGTGGQKLLVDPARRLVVVNRVDTGEGFSRALWFTLGPRVINPQFFELADRIYSAILQDDQHQLDR